MCSSNVLYAINVCSSNKNSFELLFHVIITSHNKWGTSSFSMINFFLNIRSVSSPQKLDFLTNFYLPISMTYCVVIYSCSTCSSIQMNNDNDLCILRFKTFHLQSYVTCYAFDYFLKLEQILLCQHNQFLLEFFGWLSLLNNR